MTSRISLKLTRPPRLNLRVLPRWPSDFIAGTGIAITYSGGHPVIAVDGAPASLVSFAPTTEVSATNVQDAIAEVGEELGATIQNTRERLTADRTYYVSHATGSNSLNDGLTVGSPFATIQHAVDVILRDIDCAGFNPGIQVAAGTFTESPSVRGQPVGNYVIGITGSSPSTHIWQCAPGQRCLTTRDYGVVVVNGFKLLCTGSSGIGFDAQLLSIIDFANIEFGAFASGFHITLSGGASVNFQGGTYSITGDCSAHWFTVGNSTLGIQSVAISLPNARTISNFLVMSGPGLVQLNSVTFTGSGAGAGTTGSKYNVSLNGVASLGGATLPGATAGATGTGGQVA